MKVNLETRYLATPQHTKNRWDICKIFFSSDFGCNFLLLEGVFHKCSKSKYRSIHQKKFVGAHFVCEKHPLHVFFFFPLFACIDLLKLFHLPIFGELRKLHAKNFMFSVKIGREIIFQSWQLFDLFFTQCYNFPIVHWLSSMYYCNSWKRVLNYGLIFLIGRQNVRFGHWQYKCSCHLMNVTSFWTFCQVLCSPYSQFHQPTCFWKWGGEPVYSPYWSGGLRWWQCSSFPALQRTTTPRPFPG